VSATDVLCLSVRRATAAVVKTGHQS